MNTKKMRLKFILLFLVALIFAGVKTSSAETQARELCFMVQGLKNRVDVKMKMQGARVSGSYHIVFDDDSQKPVTSAFAGTRFRTKTGWILKIRFPNGAPYELAPGTKLIVWRLGRRGGQVLIIPTYGRNYQTGKYQAYEMQLNSCRDVANQNMSRA